MIGKSVADSESVGPIEAPDVGFLVFDASDKIEFASHEILGFYQSLDSIGQITGMTYRDFLYTLLENGEFAGKAAADDPKTWIENRLKNHRQDGISCEEQLFDGRIIEVKEQDLGDGRFVARWTETTEFTRLRDQVEDIMESTQDGFALWDQRNRLVAFNKMFLSLFSNENKTPQRGDDFFNVVVGLINGNRVLLDCEAEEWIRDYLADRRLPTFSRTLAFADGRHFLVRERRARDGGITSLFIDITDLKKKERALLDHAEMLERSNYELETSRIAFEEQGKQLAGLAEKVDAAHLETLKAKKELQDAHDDLEQKVHERTANLKLEIEKREAIARELSKANQLVLTANEMKTGFLASMSHELRTPLNAIVGFSEVIDNEVFGEIGCDAYKEYVTNIADSARHLLETINNILEISAIESNKIALDEGVFELQTALQVPLRLLKPRAEAHRLEIVTQIDPRVSMVRGDERRIKQVFLNLISNAIKFSDAKEEVVIDINLDRGENLKIKITDHGVGMTEKDIELAQIPFGQEDPMVARKHEGTGLGLPLTKTLVELHGGSLEIDSAPEKGTTVTVTLPSSRVIG